MRTRLRAFAFPLLFFLGVIVASILAALRWGAVYDIPAGILVAALIAFLILYPLSMHWSRKEASSKMVQGIFITLSWIAGALYLLFLTTFLEWLLTRLVPSLGSRTPWTLPVVTLILFLVSWWRARTFRVTRTTIPLEGVKRRVRLVQVSDLHLGVILKRPFVERLAEAVKRERPDVVAITGDVFDGTGTPSADTLRPLALSRVPVLAVLGNHDGYYGYGKSARLLRQAGITVLRGTTLTRRGVRFGGLDSPLHATGGDGIQGLDRLETPDVLLYQIPSSPEKAEKRGVKIFLAGHTHAGQLFPFSLFVRLFFRYIRGWHRLGGMRLHVSPGTGSWGPMLRLGAAPEITVMDLVPSRRQGPKPF